MSSTRLMRLLAWFPYPLKIQVSPVQPRPCPLDLTPCRISCYVPADGLQYLPQLGAKNGGLDQPGINDVLPCLAAWGSSPGKLIWTRRAVFGNNCGMSLGITEEIIARQPPESEAIIRLLLAKIAEFERESKKSSRGGRQDAAKRLAAAQHAISPARFSSDDRRRRQPGATLWLAIAACDLRVVRALGRPIAYCRYRSSSRPPTCTFTTFQGVNGYNPCNRHNSHSTFGSSRPIGGSWRGRILRRLIACLVPPNRSACIVDVGCGTGGNIGCLNDDYTCVGIDASGEAIELARSRYPNVRFICGDAFDCFTDLAPEPTWSC